MLRFNRMIALLVVAAPLAFVACSGDADVDVNTDSTGVNGDANVDVDTAGGVNVDTAGGPDVNLDSGHVSMGGEGMEKLVETKLIAEPGFSGVTVESEGEGTIVLNGTVASDAEKTKAEEIAKTVDGVTSVKNNLTVK